MKAISLWQPWASLWLTEHKIHETRTWPTSHRGWLLVHAGKKVVDPKGLGIIANGPWPILEQASLKLPLPLGAVIGAVYIADCQPTNAVIHEARKLNDIHCGDFSIGRFAWKKSKAAKFGAPIEFTGKQGFFHVPEHVLEGVMARLTINDWEEEYDFGIPEV